MTCRICGELLTAPQQPAATAEAQSEGEMREIQGLVRCAKCRWYHADWYVSCVNCGELLRAQVDADTGDLSGDEMGQTPGAHRVRQDCTCTACEDTKALARDVARLTRERDEARAEVGRLRALVQQWQPIETAPKDGTPVLGFMPSYYQGLGGQSVVVWMEDEWYDMRAFATTPSHWMPLPAAPTTREEP